MQFIGTNSLFICSKAFQLQMYNNTTTGHGENVFGHEEAYLPLANTPTTLLSSEYAPVVSAHKLNSAFQVLSGLASSAITAVTGNDAKQGDVSLVHPSMSYAIWQTTKYLQYRFDIKLTTTKDVLTNVIIPMRVLAKYTLPSRVNGSVLLRSPVGIDVQAIINNARKDTTNAIQNTGTGILVQYGGIVLKNMIITQIEFTPSDLMVRAHVSNVDDTIAAANAKVGGQLSQYDKKLFPHTITAQISMQSLFMPTADEFMESVR